MSFVDRTVPKFAAERHRRLSRRTHCAALAVPAQSRAALLLRDLLLAQRRIHKLEARLRKLRGDDDVGLDTADSAASIVSWVLDANDEGAQEASIGLPAATPRERDLAFRTAHRVLARTHPNAEIWLHQLFGGALSRNLWSGSKCEWRRWYLDALYLLRELVEFRCPERRARALRFLRERILRGDYNSLLPWIDLEALARPGADPLTLLCLGVERFLQWLAERCDLGDDELWNLHRWNVLRLAAHARLIRAGVPDTYGP